MRSTTTHTPSRSLPVSLYLPAILAGVSLFCWLYLDTIQSMVAIWERSETFAHGYLILPIAIWLSWRMRDQLRAAVVQPAPWLLVPAALAGFGWFAASIVGVQVIEQLAAVSIFILMIGAMAGWQVLRLLAFPLGYLYFMVPIGEGLIEPMMNGTAWVVIKAVQLTGIPIYAQGTFFSLPSGDWSVVEGCSGVRYLIASLALGTLYAYLTYQKIRKRLLFIAASFLVPIVANWLRAFLIVMLGHFSGMKLATGVDHIIYGWFFFGLVIFILFTVGSRWRDLEPSDTDHDPGDANEMARQSGPATSQHGGFVTWLATLAALSLFPLLVTLQATDPTQEQPKLPELTLQGQPGVEPATDWTPRYIDPIDQRQWEFDVDGQTVGLYLALYRRQGEGELVNSQNVMVRQKHPVWHQLEQQVHSEQERKVIETWLSSSRQDLLTWHYNLIHGQTVINPYLGKLRELQAALALASPYELGVVLYTTYNGERQQSQQVLSQLLAEITPQLTKLVTELGAFRG